MCHHIPRPLRADKGNLRDGSHCQAAYCLYNCGVETQEPITPRTRAASERQFYNHYAKQLSATQLQPQGVFTTVCLENVQLLENLGDVRGKRLLDIGCGQGDTSVAFALRGAEVWAVDVSEQMVELTRKLAACHGVRDRVKAEVCRVEDMTYASDFFDIIFADGVLHHLDMTKAVPNLLRVMKPGGRGLFLEPQKGSIFIDIYRLFAKDLRTPDERPLEQKDFEFLQSQFGRLEHREYHLVSLLLFGVRFGCLKLTGKTFPYWMDEVRQGKYHPRLLRVLQQADEFLLGRFPVLRKRCWMTVISVQK